MIRVGSLPQRHVDRIDQDVLAEMAALSGRHIEIHGNTAYLKVGRRTWTAELAPAGEVTQ